MDEQERRESGSACSVQRSTFPKRERIVSRTLIEQLFSKGDSRSVSAYPLRAVYLRKQREDLNVPVQVMVSVSKRHFKRAVKRNRVKRQIREAYRLNKQLLTERIPSNLSLAIAFIWLSDELCGSPQVERSVRKLLAKVAEHL